MIVGGITAIVAFAVVLMFLKHRGVFLDFSKLSDRNDKKEN